jgi:hypothetical protein
MLKINITNLVMLIVTMVIIIVKLLMAKLATIKLNMTQKMIK